MGFLTTIVIHNDAIHDFESDPEQFGKTILEGIGLTNLSHEKLSFKGNHIAIFPSRHADNETLYLHKGNTVTEINGSSFDFLKLFPHVAKDFVQSAERILKYAKRKLK